VRLPKEVRALFRRQGRRGGKARAARLPAGVREAIARRGALRRWVRVRFGAPRFEDLGLPGGAFVDRGLDALAEGRETVESLALSLSAPRLRREGVPLPAATFADGDRRLYRLLERKDGELAHARYLAHLRQIASFADALHRVAWGRGLRAS
jgi:hypothetical protein